MSKKVKKDISSVVTGLFLISSLALYWSVFESTNVYIFLVIILITSCIGPLTYNLLPDKKSTRTSTRKPSAKKKPKASHSPNRLREDKVIMVSDLEDLSWREFERLCFLYYKAKEYKPRETGEGADGGVDLVVYNRRDRADEAVQIKHYIGSGNQITVREIRELNSAKRNHNCVLSTFITTSGYTRDALKQADDYRMTCRDINWVKNNIVKWQKQMQGKAV